MFETDFAALKRLAELSREEVGESEEDVKVNFVVPLLEAMGHSRLRFEHKRKDILLREGLPRGASVVVETKRYGEPLDRHLAQLDRLALGERCLLALMSNGAEVRVYAPMQTWARGIAETEVRRVSREALANCFEGMELAALVGRQALSSGRALEQIAKAFKARAVKEEFARYAEEKAAHERAALDARLREVEGRLAELARERAKLSQELESLSASGAGGQARDSTPAETSGPPEAGAGEAQEARALDEWTDEDLYDRLGPNQRSMLGALVAAGRRTMPLRELTRAVGLKPQVAWGTLAAFTMPVQRGGRDPLLEITKGPSLPVRARGAVVTVREKYWGTLVRLYGGGTVADDREKAGDGG